MKTEERFRLLAAVSLVDGHLDPREEQVLLRAAERLGVARERAVELVRELMSGGRVGAVRPPSDPIQRGVLFQDMIDLAVADGQVTPQELACLQKLSPSFGVEARRVPRMLERALLDAPPVGLSDLAGAAAGASAVALAAPRGDGQGGAPRGAAASPARTPPRRGAGEAGCPSCGAPIEFKNARSVAAVCEYCDTTVARKDGGAALKDLGKISRVVDSGSPIQLGASGKCFGVGFSVLGLLQVEHSSGYWNEWFLEWADRRTGWLGEALGQYFVTFPDADSIKTKGKGGLPDVPAFDELTPGQRVNLAGKRYTVAEARLARATGTRGETPFVISEGYELPFADLRRSDRGFATIDYSEEPPLVFLGRSVRWKELNMRGYRRFDGWRV